MSLSISNLTLRRGNRRILEAVTFDVKAGEVGILTGPNGSGKTTLLRAVAGLGPIESGLVLCNQNDLVFAGHLDAVKAGFSVVENLRFWASIYVSENFDLAMGMLDLESLAHRLAARLSAGQKRRLGLARVVLSGAKLWLLDEPTTALDKQTTKKLETLIELHCANGGTALISTHTALALKTAQEIPLEKFAPNTSGHVDPFLDGAMT